MRRSLELTFTLMHSHYVYVEMSQTDGLKGQYHYN